MSLESKLNQISNNETNYRPYTTGVNKIADKLDEIMGLHGADPMNPSSIGNQVKSYKARLLGGTDMEGANYPGEINEINEGLDNKLKMLKNGQVQIAQAHHDILNEVRTIDGNIDMIQEGCSGNVMGMVAGLLPDIVENFENGLEEAGRLLDEAGMTIDAIRSYLATVSTLTHNVKTLLNRDWDEDIRQWIEFLKSWAMYKFLSSNECLTALGSVIFQNVGVWNPDYEPPSYTPYESINTPSGPQPGYEGPNDETYLIGLEPDGFTPKGEFRDPSAAITAQSLGLFGLFDAIAKIEEWSKEYKDVLKTRGDNAKNTIITNANLAKSLYDAGDPYTDTMTTMFNAAKDVGWSIDDILFHTNLTQAIINEWFATDAIGKTLPGDPRFTNWDDTVYTGSQPGMADADCSIITNPLVEEEDSTNSIIGCE